MMFFVLLLTAPIALFMASSPQKFKGMHLIAIAWLATASLWVVWGAG